MATNIFANITARGTSAVFKNAMAQAPNVWENHVLKVPSDTPDEQHVWMGMTPVPREFVSGRSFQGMRDFTFNLTNKEYELSFIIDQNSVEDDKHGLINTRVSEAALVWSTFKDSLLATLIQDGDGTNQGNAYDGNTFFNATRTLGSSGTIDNIDTSNITTTTAPTLLEAQAAFTQARVLFWGYNDDQGRAGYATDAMNNMRLICDPQYEARFTEMNEAQLTERGGDTNVFFKGKLASIDVLPYLTNADVQIYFTVSTPTRAPFIYQERTPLQVEVFTDSASVADNHGLKVLVRQRFRLGYGEFRYAIEHTFT